MADIEEKPKTTTTEGDKGTGAIDEVTQWREDHRGEPVGDSGQTTQQTLLLVDNGTLPGLELVHDGGSEPSADTMISNESGIEKRGVKRDENGRVESLTDKNGNSTSFKYDDSGNVTEFTISDQEGKSTTYKRQEGIYRAYDENGDPILDENGQQKTFTGDAIVDQQSGSFTMRNADGSYTEHFADGSTISVDNDGRLAAADDPNTDKHWSFKYDDKGNLVQVGLNSKNYELGEDGKWYQLNDFSSGRATDAEGNPITFPGSFEVTNYGNGNFSYGIHWDQPLEPVPNPNPNPPEKPIDQTQVMQIPRTSSGSGGLLVP